MKKILIISTDQYLLNTLQSDLPVWNFEVQTINNPEGIFNQLNTIKPDLLVIDFILDDINGGALCHQIKCDAVLRDLPVILLSDYPALERFSAKFGCNTILRKPFQMYELVDVIQSVLDSTETSIDQFNKAS